MNFVKKNIVITLLFMTIIPWADAKIVGSWNNVSYDTGIYFPQDDTNNTIQGFSFTSGFSLESIATACTFNSRMPVSGDIYINGGDLWLEEDLILRNTANIVNAGTIYGGGHFIELSESINQLLFSPILGGKLILTQELIFQDPRPQSNVPVYATVWSPNGQYVAIGTFRTPGGEQLKIFSFDGTSLTQVAKKSFASVLAIVSISWDPTSNYIAVGGQRVNTAGVVQSASGFLGVYEYDESQSGESAVGLVWSLDSTFAYGVSAVVWHPTGKWLAVGSPDDNREISIYERDTKTPPVSVVNLATNQDVSRNAMDWDITGSYLAVGLTQHASGDELRIYHFQGTTLTFTMGNNVGETVRALDWHPTDSWLAVGLSSGSERLRIYHFNGNTWTLDNKTSAYQGLNVTVNSVHWCNGGQKLAVGLESNGESELQVYTFNATTATLSLAADFNLDFDINAVRWSPSCNYLAVGSGAPGDNQNSNYFFSIYGVPSAGTVLTLRDISPLYLNSDVALRSPIIFEGESFIDTRGNKFIVDGSGSFAIAPNSTLRFRNGRVRLDKPGAFSLTAPTSRLEFQNTKLELASDAFIGNGSVLIDGDLLICGPYRFTYATKYTSTIDSFSNLQIADETTLVVGKVPTASEQPIVFTDDTSSLAMDNASLIVTGSGWHITKGNIDISGRCTFSIDNFNFNEGLMLGDGTIDTHATLTIHGDSELRVAYGPLIMNPYVPESLCFLGDGARLALDDEGIFYAKNSLQFNNGSLYFASNATLTKDPWAYLTANRTRIHDYHQDFHLTGTIGLINYMILDQNDELILNYGNLSNIITVSRDNNLLGGDGVLSGYILFADQNSSLTWAIDAKLNKDKIVLNGGLVTLDKDLEFYHDLEGVVAGYDFLLSGTLNLENHVVQLNSSDSVWTGSFYFLGNGSRVVLNAKVSLSGTWTMDGIQTIDGQGHTLELAPEAKIFVTAGSRLTFCNAIVKNLSGDKIVCNDDSAQIVLDNVLVIADGDRVFDKGSLIFRSDVFLIGGSGCSEEEIYTFSYESSQTSSIDLDSTLHIGRGMRLTIGNQTASQTHQALEFRGKQAVIHLDEGILRVADYGLQLTCGRMRVSNSSIVDVDTTYGLTVGDGSIAIHDFTIEIEGDAKLTIDNGKLYYNNVAAEDRIIFIAIPATLRINSLDGLTASRNLLLKKGTLRFPSVDYLETLGSAVIYQEHMWHMVDMPYSKYIVQAEYRSGFGYLLIDDGFIAMQSGKMTLPLVFDSGVSMFGGVGIVESSLTLRDNHTMVLAGFESDLHSNIVMNGGTLRLATHLNFVGDKTLTGSGKVILNNNQFSFGTDEVTLDHDIFWDMSSAINLNAKTNLSGTWTFGGTGNLNGHGNILDLSLGGTIFIDNNTMLHMNDLIIKGLGDTNGGSLLFGNDNSKVFMSNVAVVLASNYTVTIGGIYVEGPTVWYLDNYTWSFDQLGSLTVDGITLWKDTLDKAIIGDISFGTPEENYLSLLNSGTIKGLGNEDWLRSQTTILGDKITNITYDVDLLFKFFSTIDHGPFNYYFDSPVTMSYNIYLGPQHKMFLQEDMTFNGSTWYIHFSRANEPLLFIDPGKTVTLQDVVLKDFHPDYVSFGDVNSNLVFGNGTTIEFIEDFTLTRQWTFTGDCKIKGFQTKITLGEGGIIDVYDHSSLVLEDLTIAGLSSITNNLLCRTNDGVITLKDSELMLSDDYTFGVGAMIFAHEAKLTGTRVFTYATPMTSTIMGESRLYVDHGTTFYYNPPIANRNLFVMTDTTSRLHLNGCVLSSTPTGLRLTNGMLLFDNYVTLSAEGHVQSEAIFFDDLIVMSLGGAYIESYGYIDMR